MGDLAPGRVLFPEGGRDPGGAFPVGELAASAEESLPPEGVFPEGV